MLHTVLLNSNMLVYIGSANSHSSLSWRRTDKKQMSSAGGSDHFKEKNRTASDGMCYLNLARVGFSDKITSEQRHEQSQGTNLIHICGKTAPGYREQKVQ